jgi:hypothetical protein
MGIAQTALVVRRALQTANVKQGIMNPTALAPSVVTLFVIDVIY